DEEGELMTLKDRRKYGFFMIDNEIVDDERLTHKEMAVYMSLCRHANRETGSCFPSLSTIGKKVKMSKNTVLNALKLLIELGYISKENRSSEDGGHASNIYYINDVGTLVHPVNKVVQEMNKGGSGDEQALVQEMNTNNTKLNKTKLTINNPRKNVSDSYSEDFENLWKTYPKKIDKKQGYKSFNTAMKKHSFEVIMSGVKGYVDHIKRNGTETKFVKHASTFFNNECYLEYVEQPKSPVLNKPKQTAISIDNLLD
ncbi:helix-turn-helix domain-containing protein, partial [Bacillus pseudomycoides]|uniref:helix-turn-helix domain-containing protein n=2 Tax=Bacillus TaxID=1386 RepID=UPI0027BB1E12